MDNQHNSWVEGVALSEGNESILYEASLYSRLTDGGMIPHFVWLTC